MKIKTPVRGRKEGRIDSQEIDRAFLSKLSLVFPFLGNKWQTDKTTPFMAPKSAIKKNKRRPGTYI